jgi:hypothetical protein
MEESVNIWRKSNNKEGRGSGAIRGQVRERELCFVESGLGRERGQGGRRQRRDFLNESRTTKQREIGCLAPDGGARSDLVESGHGKGLVNVSQRARHSRRQGAGVGADGGRRENQTLTWSGSHVDMLRIRSPKVVGAAPPRAGCPWQVLFGN